MIFVNVNLRGVVFFFFKELEVNISIVVIVVFKKVIYVKVDNDVIEKIIIVIIIKNVVFEFNLIKFGEVSGFLVKVCIR